MTDAELAQLRLAASRSDYRSMAALARALYEAGATVREVIEQCYGVALPDEFFVLASAPPTRDELPVLYTNQPWKLAVPLDRGGPPPVAGAIDKLEQRALAADPGLVPLLVLENPDLQHGDSLLSYHVDELAAGRSTVLGLPRFFDGKPAAVRCATSLLAALHDYFADELRRLEANLRSPYNRGAGSIDPRDVDASREWLAKVEDLMRRAGFG